MLEIKELVDRDDIFLNGSSTGEMRRKLILKRRGNEIKSVMFQEDGNSRDMQISADICLFVFVCLAVLR